MSCWHKINLTVGSCHFMSSQEIPGYFKGTAVAASVLDVVLALPVNFNLYLNDSELAMLPFG